MQPLANATVQAGVPIALQQVHMGPLHSPPHQPHSWFKIIQVPHLQGWDHSPRPSILPYETAPSLPCLPWTCPSFSSQRHTGQDRRQCLAFPTITCLKIPAAYRLKHMGIAGSRLQTSGECVQHLPSPPSWFPLKLASRNTLIYPALCSILLHQVEKEEW